MKIFCKSITPVIAKNADGEVRTQDVEIVDANGEGTGKHERQPIVERIVVELVDENGDPVAKHSLLGHEKHDFVEGEEAHIPGHEYERAPAAE